MSENEVSYFVFDVESIADGRLVNAIKYWDQELSPEEAVEKYGAERTEKYGSEFIPYTYHIPIAVVVAKISSDFRLLDLVALDEPNFRPHIITEHFWRGWLAYEMPTLVTFNGRNFDIPVLEMAAYRYGINISNWFNILGKSWEQKRNRYNLEAQLDLQDVLTNFGATRFAGGLDLAANILGKPGKMDVEGHMVQDMYNRGELAEIANYCRCDVLDTYFVFLRIALMMGKLTLEEERSRVKETRAWLNEKSQEHPIYSNYLKSWEEWDNPWSHTPLFD
ncbi:MAG TPA: ribonuclease H-like domain-containing protein [Pirellulaceae bacterium]|nr:ribonuclease H-like domain-containing protein [Pirellulaceae bacterium]HMO93666.1 ribonuclease H-like domain-containing protein [Pirellulaceae bacterium]HMP68408.1 ribonuclease H-like domain-containing protein [Pirellulaceae bacterium]